tara:strand:+ start:3140 stop:4465 length:1326 start_codon:yes stop_codon:yes gene_type:complete
MKLSHFNKKPTFEQHDNEDINYYQFSSSKIKLEREFEEKLKIDICIVGGGLTGISSAVYLAKKGFNVIVLEARNIGWGASGRNGGQLGGGLRKEQKILENKLGTQHALELWKMSLEAVDEVLRNINKYNIECDLQNGVLTAGYYKNDEKYFIEEKEYLQKKYNYNEYIYFNNKEIREQINSKKYYSGLLNKGSYHLHPLKYLYGLTKEALKLNIKIYENTPVKEIIETTNGVKIITQNNIIHANHAVVGCNGYLDNLLGNVRKKFMPINNYILATKPLGKEKALSLIKNNYAVCDTRFIIDYYRLSSDWRMLFGGGETLTGNYLKHPLSFVKKRMSNVFPELKEYDVDFCWGGTLAITISRFPNFGTIKNNKIIYAHGYSGHGLALTTLAGKLIAEYLSGEQERFNFFSSIPHISIPAGDLFRRPAYSLGVAYYKLRDFIH